MKIVKQKKSKKLTITIVACGIVVLLLTSGIAYATLKGYIFNQTPKANSETEDIPKTIKEVDNGTPSQEQIDAGHSTKKDAVNGNGEASPTSKLSLDLVAFIKSDTVVHIGININNKVTNTGTCNLELSKDGVVNNYNSEIVAVAGYSTCKGFDISGLSPGQWSIKATVTSGLDSGEASGQIRVYV